MSPIPNQFEIPAGRYYVPFCFHINLADIASDGDVITEFTPGFPGTLVEWFWIQGTPVTTAAKAATLNMEIGEVDVVTTPGTNATIALTSATCTPLGKVIAGTAPNYSNRFDKDDTISVEASSVTAFVEGDGMLVIIVEGKIM